MWDLIVSVPDHYLSFYLGLINAFSKARRYRRLWSYVVEETGEPGRSLPCHMPTLGFELGTAAVRSEGFSLRYPCHFAHRNRPNKTFNSDIRVLDIFRSQKQINKLSKKISSQPTRKILLLLSVCLFCCISRIHMSPVKRICVFEHSVMTNFNCACPAIQRDHGSGFLSEGSSWLTACMSEQRRFWRDCADAQARLNLRCSHRR